MAVLQPAAPGRRAMTREERNYLLARRLKSLIAHAILIVFGIAFMLPFVWMAQQFAEAKCRYLRTARASDTEDAAPRKLY